MQNESDFKQKLSELRASGVPFVTIPFLLMLGDGAYTELLPVLQRTDDVQYNLDVILPRTLHDLVIFDLEADEIASNMGNLLAYYGIEYKQFVAAKGAMAEQRSTLKAERRDLWQNKLPTLRHSQGISST